MYEYIIVDGGSTDSTMKIVESNREAFENVGVKYHYISEPDKGISDAFNKGIKMASGDIVGLINADDALEKNVTKYLEEAEKDADIYYGDALWIDKANNLSYIAKPKETNPDRFYRLLYEMLLIHPAVFVKREAYERVGYFDITFRYCMDQELLYRMYRAGKTFYYMDKVLAKVNAGGISDTNAGKVFKEACRIPLMYGEPDWKANAIKLKKQARDKLARFVKKIGLYRMMRGLR